MSELEQLIAGQEKDDTYRVYSVSVDAWPSGADLLHRRSRQLVTDPRHGTNGCYTSLACRCDKCKAAAAEARREYRRRRRVDKGQYTYQLCCQDCGGHNIERKRSYQTEGAT